LSGAFRGESRRGGDVSEKEFWREHAARLLEVLKAQDLMREARLEAAYWAAPRHCFIDRMYVRDAVTMYWSCRPQPQDYQTNSAWLNDVYQEQPVIVRTNDAGMPVCSNSAPSLVFKLLGLLDVRAGDRVLEVGTGTGQLTSLLGFLAATSGEVTSLEVDPELAETARLRLDSLGGAKAVSILQADAQVTPLADAEFDCVVSTASSPTVPDYWPTALRRGGRLCMEIRGSLSGAILVAERPDHGGKLAGSFVDRRGAFMPLRRTGNGADEGVVLPFGFGLNEAQRRPSEGVGFKQVISRPFDWYCQLELPDSRLIALSPESGSDMYLVADECLDAVKLPADGDVPGSELISYGDTSSLAERLTAAWHGWHAAGCPARRDYTMTIDDQGRQHVVLRNATGSWTLQ
jgi:protein-L-isoaspartate O-methyltransferase